MHGVAPLGTGISVLWIVNADGHKRRSLCTKFTTPEDSFSSELAMHDLHIGNSSGVKKNWITNSRDY